MCHSKLGCHPRVLLGGEEVIGGQLIHRVVVRLRHLGVRGGLGRLKEGLAVLRDCILHIGWGLVEVLLKCLRLRWL